MVEGSQTHMDVRRCTQTNTDKRKANCVRWVGGHNLQMIDVCSRTFGTYYMCCSITLTFAIYSPDGAQHWITNITITNITNITNSFAPQVSAEEGSLKHFVVVIVVVVVVVCFVLLFLSYSSNPKWKECIIQVLYSASVIDVSKSENFCDLQTWGCAAVATPVPARVLLRAQVFLTPIVSNSEHVNKVVYFIYWDEPERASH